MKTVEGGQKTGQEDFSERHYHELQRVYAAALQLSPLLGFWFSHHEKNTS